MAGVEPLLPVSLNAPWGRGVEGWLAVLLEDLADRVDYAVTVPARVAVGIEGAAGNLMLTGPIGNATVNTSPPPICAQDELGGPI